MGHKGCTITFQSPLGLDALGKLTAIYADLVKLFPERYPDNVDGWMDWLVDNEYGTHIHEPMKQVNKLMEAKK